MAGLAITPIIALTRMPLLARILICQISFCQLLRSRFAVTRDEGVSELVAYGEFRSLDMTPLGVERIIARRPLFEHAVI